jgi:hypothetical protein
MSKKTKAQPQKPEVKPEELKHDDVIVPTIDAPVEAEVEAATEEKAEEPAVVQPAIKAQEEQAKSSKDIIKYKKALKNMTLLSGTHLEIGKPVELKRHELDALIAAHGKDIESRLFEK